MLHDPLHPRNPRLTGVIQPASDHPRKIWSARDK
jgi:hypothetical protein